MRKLWSTMITFVYDFAKKQTVKALVNEIQSLILRLKPVYEFETARREYSRSNQSHHNENSFEHL